MSHIICLTLYVVVYECYIVLWYEFSSKCFTQLLDFTVQQTLDVKWFINCCRSKRACLLLCQLKSRYIVCKEGSRMRLLYCSYSFYRLIYTKTFLSFCLQDSRMRLLKCLVCCFKTLIVAAMFLVNRHSVARARRDPAINNWCMLTVST